MAPADRDYGLHRISVLTRWIVAGAVVVTGAVSALAAGALTAKSSPANTNTNGSGSETPNTQPGAQQTDPGVQINPGQDDGPQGPQGFNGGGRSGGPVSGAS